MVDPSEIVKLLNVPVPSAPSLPGFPCAPVAPCGIPNDKTPVVVLYDAVADAPADNVLTVTPPAHGCVLTETLPSVSNDNILFALVVFTGKNVDTATVS